MTNNSRSFSSNNSEDFITVLGLGSLLSERSSRTTFPNLCNFRLGRVPNYRRVFGHPASVFFQNDVANSVTLEMSSLSAEYAGDDEATGFICSIFEVPNDMMMKDGIPSVAYLEREEEFDIVSVPYLDFTAIGEKKREGGILCTRSSDETFLERWGKERFEKHYKKYGIHTIWGWKPDSGLRPCAPYLRHCVLAAKAMGQECYDSFLDETFLVDRTTTIRSYLESNPQIMITEPPPGLRERYGG
eukprot:CAMPEP_0194211614 /NCGR_PEP_ID=MMETSP0156-20130528/10700_1 /TAXON_ID=33649 /ORGANISM="Thalassionema nitzschioides, Strain L26-B" /LENGTH=243 /DNA_ID=CAMNT_0038939223 /DNA_START=88 /DNA_END=819 /DNA_ORIENTATION=-